MIPKTVNDVHGEKSEIHLKKKRKKKFFFKKVINKISCADINVHKTNKLFLEV